MRPPRISDVEGRELERHPPLPADIEQVLRGWPQAEDAPERPPRSPYQLSLGLAVAAILLAVPTVAVSVAALVVALQRPATVLEARPLAPELVILGRGGRNVMNCAADTLTFFLAAEDASLLDRPLVDITVADNRVSTAMRPVRGGYLLVLDVKEGSVVPAATPGASAVRVGPGEKMQVRVDRRAEPVVIAVNGGTARGIGGEEACDTASRRPWRQ